MPKFMALVETFDGRQSIPIEAQSLDHARAFAELDFGNGKVIELWPVSDPIESKSSDVQAIVQKDNESRKRKALIARNVIGLIFFRIGLVAGLGAWVFSAAKLSQIMTDPLLVNHSKVAIDSIIYFLAGIVTYLCGWLIRCMITGKRYFL
jgi:hypothetical protein